MNLSKYFTNKKLRSAFQVFLAVMALTSMVMGLFMEIAPLVSLDAVEANNADNIIRVNATQNNIPITEVEFEVLRPVADGGPYTYIQTGSDTSTNPTPVDVPVNIIRIDFAGGSLVPTAQFPTTNNFNDRVGDTSVDAGLVVDVNLRGAFLSCQRFARMMVSCDEGGVIIAIASGSARFARVGAAHYGASKAGLVALTRTMALELAPHGVRVNAVSPGIVAVQDGPPLDEGYVAAMTSMVPWGRVGRPEDVAEVVVAVAGPAFGYVTGQDLRVDGGLSAGRFGIPISGRREEGATT